MKAKPVREGQAMTLNGVVQNGKIELEGGVTLPEGTRVKVVPEPVQPVLESAEEDAELRQWITVAKQAQKSWADENPF